MEVVPVDDPADPRLADYLSLTDVALRRRIEPEHGLFMAESAKVVTRALTAGCRPRSGLTSPRWLAQSAPILEPYAGELYLVPDDVLAEVTGFAVHRGMLAAMDRPVLRPVADVVRDARRVAVLEDLVDHTNVGAVFRSAAALGVDAVLVSPRCADPLYRRSVRVSMGTVFQVSWTRIVPWPDGIGALQRLGFVVAGMTLGADAITLDALTARAHPRLALVFGTEGHGLSAGAADAVDVQVTIPMAGGVDSLNIAASSAVAFYATR